MGELGLRRGRVDLRSAGPITFGPAGILFLADNVAATVFAVDVADPDTAGRSEPFDLEDVEWFDNEAFGPEDLRGEGTTADLVAWATGTKERFDAWWEKRRQAAEDAIWAISTYR